MSFYMHNSNAPFVYPNELQLTRQLLQVTGLKGQKK